MNHGARPERLKRRDYDYLPSYHPQLFGGTRTLAQELQEKIGAPQFPAEYLTDKTNWLPNQNTDGLPFGCTDYSSTKLALILGVTNAGVKQLEAITGANASGGYGVLASIDAARTTLQWFGWRFTIQSTGALDYFDTFRLAQVSGLPEQRAVSVGSPWFPSWENAIVLAGTKILPMPTAVELAAVKKNVNAFSWHNYVADGWSQNFAMAPGQLLYRLDSWQGALDYVYMDRATLNTVMDLYGTIGVTATSATPPSIVSMPLPDWFWSLIHSLFGIRY